MNSTLGKALIALIILGAAIGITSILIANKDEPEKTVTKVKDFLVDAQRISKGDLNFIVESQGTALPRTETLISSQVSGRVIFVSDNFIAGGLFKQGDVLVKLEAFDFETDLKSAQAELARARAALDEEIARGKVAKEEWKSVRQGKIPELALRKPQLATEIANVSAAEAQVERAERNLDRTVIRAPYDGLIREKNTDIGQFVTVGSQLARVFGTDIADVRIPLSDNDLAYLTLTSESGATEAAQVILHADIAGQRVQWLGRLVRDEGILDETRRVIYAVAQVDDPYKRKEGAHGYPLKFGRFVQAEITGARAEGLVVLPRGLLRLDDTILVVDDDKKLRIREVQIQRRDDEYVYISSGLNDGEWVTGTSIPNPFDGMRVRLSSELKQRTEGSDSSIVTVK